MDRTGYDRGAASRAASEPAARCPRCGTPVEVRGRLAAQTICETRRVSCFVCRAPLRVTRAPQPGGRVETTVALYDRSTAGGES